MLAPGWWRCCCRVGRCVVTNVGPTPESDLHVSVVDVEVGQVGSRVELFEEIRRGRRVEALSMRELAERHKVEVFIPQSHEPGAEAEVDFGEFYATIGGLKVKVWMFVMRLSHSGRAFHIAYGTQAQEAFLEGHVLAFQHFGGVPGRVRYDNLKPAVIRILKGRDRTEAERFVALRSHYGFESFFCQPGLKGAHEKGGGRERSAGSAAGTWSRSRRRQPWPRSTSASPLLIFWTTPG